MIPVGNNVGKMSRTFLKKDDFNSAFLGVIAEIYLKFSKRIHVGAEYSLFAQNFYIYTVGPSYPGGMYAGGFSLNQKLRWFGANIKHIIHP